MRRLASLVVALAGIALLASCSFNPLELLSGSDRRLSHERMEQILDAINDQDAATLKSMFTEYALAEYSAEIDEGLEYLLSLFPDGDVVWEDPSDPVAAIPLSCELGREGLLAVLRRLH
jgi:hypothetical protein